MEIGIAIVRGGVDTYSVPEGSVTLVSFRYSKLQCHVGASDPSGGPNARDGEIDHWLVGKSGRDTRGGRWRWSLGYACRILEASKRRLRSRMATSSEYLDIKIMAATGCGSGTVNLVDIRGDHDIQLEEQKLCKPAQQKEKKNRSSIYTPFIIPEMAFR